MKLVVLTGIPGSGSTTLLNKALEEAEKIWSTNTKVKELVYGGDQPDMTKW